MGYGYEGVGCIVVFFFFNDTATTEIYTLSLHDALPILLCHQDSLEVFYDLIISSCFDTVIFLKIHVARRVVKKFELLHCKELE